MKLPAIFPLSAVCRLLAVIGLSAVTAMAGRYPASGTQTFDGTGPITDLGDGSVIASNNGVAAVVNNLLRLTQRGTTNTNSVFRLPDLDPNRALSSWDATLQVRMDKPSFFAAADGWALNVGPIPEGNGDGEGGFAMAKGLVIAFDTYNSGNDPPSIEIFANGISVGNFPQTFQFSTSTLRALAIHWDAAGLDVTYTVNTTPVAICTNLPTPGYVPAAGHRFAFTARTGSNTEGVYLDNLLVSTVAGAPLETGGPVISEFSADNEEMLEDENGDSSDWIEIYNGKSTSTNLSGWVLTDVVASPNGWALPNVSIPAYSYLIVFASSKNRANPAFPLHTNFSLAKTAGYLALVKPGGVLASEFNYGQQAADVSYGLLPSGGTYIYGYLETPSPGGTNGGLQAAGPPAEDVVFLKDGLPTPGGLFSAGFNLSVQPPVAAGSVVRYTLNNTPPTGTSASYSAPFAVNATNTVRARVYSPGRLPGPVSSRTFVQLDPSLTNYHASGKPFSSNLPIIVFDSFGVPVDSYSSSSQARPYRLTYAVVIAQDPLAAGADANRARITGPADFQGRSGTHVRGESSSGFPQKSYSWELWNNENEDKDASVLGFPAESDWVLHAPYTDKAMMRNFLVYDRMRALNGKAAAMGVKFVEVFFNQDGGTLTESDYRGVYVLVEKIKRGTDRVNIEKLNDSMTDPALISGGYMFKKDKAGIDNVSFTTATYGQGFQFVEPEVPNTAQKNWLTSYMNNFEAALNGANFANPTTGYAAYINPLSFVDNQWFVEITKQIDGYRLSTYFYKDRNGKVSCAPVWDYNLSSFNADYNGGDTHVGWYRDLLSSADYYYWPKLHQDPNYKILHWDRYWELRKTMFASNALLSYLDGLAGQLANGSTTPVTNSMANQAPLAENPAMRQFRKWPILGTYVWPNPTNYGTRTKFWNGPTLTPTYYTAADGEVDAMKSFLQQRLAWIDDQNYVGSTIYRPPVFSLTGGSVAAGTTLTITRHSGSAPAGYSYASGGTLYYTTNDTDPRSTTGAAVGTAYSSPVVLNTSATVKARLFFNNSWSPLATASFIVNAAPASPANLVISELCYKPTPPAPGTPEYLAGFISGNNFEYVELLNVSGGNVDLTNCQFTTGITFSFVGLSQAQLTLAPGGRVLVVGNEAAFTLRHGSGQADRILGTFGGNLNNSGETVTLLAANGSVIASVAYGIAEPWPLAAQDAGYSLVLNPPGPSPTYGAASFRASLQPGGTPGTAAGFAATLTLGSLERVHTGSPLAATAITNPPGLAVAVTYNGSANAPTNVGSYLTIATVSAPDYTGTSAGTMSIYDHARPLVGGTTLGLGALHAGYGGTVTSAGVAVGNDTGLRLNLAGSAPSSGLVSLTSLAGITPGETGLIAARLAPGRPAGIINDTITYVFADDSTLEGASPNLDTADFQVIGQVYSGDMVWRGPSGRWRDPARWDDFAAAGVHAAPGFNEAFAGIDGATFASAGGNVTVVLDGAAPSLNRLTFSSGGHALITAQGDGNQGLILAGGDPAITCHGTNAIATPVTLQSDLKVMVSGTGDILTILGPLRDAGGNKGLTLTGNGTLVLSGSNTFAGPTTVTGGTLAGTGLLAGPVAVGADGAVNPGALGGVGTLTVGVAAISGTLRCDLSPAACDTLTVNGALALSGATLSFNLLGVPVAASYVLVSYTGTAPAFATVVNLPAGYQLDYSLPGVIRLQQAGGFESWAEANGLTPSNNGSDQDPDHDGMCNLTEYCLGGQPLASDPSILPKSALIGANLVLTYQRNDASENDTTQIGQWSTDHINWTDLAPVLVNENGPNPDDITISIPLSNAVGGRLFGRLKLSKP